jgi:hypothetical protein
MLQHSTRMQTNIDGIGTVKRTTRDANAVVNGCHLFRDLKFDALTSLERLRCCMHASQETAEATRRELVLDRIELLNEYQ